MPETNARRTEPVLKIPILQINRQPRELVLVATARFYRFNACICNFWGGYVNPDGEVSGHKAGSRLGAANTSPLAPVNYYNDASYTICVHNTLLE